ncbi:MAG: peptidylprolyl isomerase [Rhodobacteraceae bacterium]|nr:peptidylprolyl isomerase [Paracoccaceae bacterium]
MRLFGTIIAAVLLLAAPVFAVEDENVLVIEVAGENTGTFEIELLPEVAPGHVERIKLLARDGLYNDVVFHRVIDGFMAQTGDVQHGKREGFNLRYAGTGGSDLPNLKAEFSDVSYEIGVVGMARGGHSIDSANSQFFIMFEHVPQLDGEYTVVGRVIAGQEVVNAIKRGDRAANGAVQDPDYMVKVQVKADIE